MQRKPLGIKSYGSIPHLPDSRKGPGDHCCSQGQARIATKQARDRHDHIIVQEKLDGSNVGIARIDGKIYPLTRAGYLASTSPFEQHLHFYQWVYEQQERFLVVLEDGERLCGEWLMQAHGTRYKLFHEPFVAFDLMKGNRRLPYDEFIKRIQRSLFVSPHAISCTGPLSVKQALHLIGEQGFHGALDTVEGVVWRVERDVLIDLKKGGARKRVVDFLVKYVRPDKVDGCYLPEVSGNRPIWNWYPSRSKPLLIKS